MNHGVLFSGFRVFPGPSLKRASIFSRPSVNVVLGKEGEEAAQQTLRGSYWGFAKLNLFSQIWLYNNADLLLSFLLSK